MLTKMLQEANALKDYSIPDQHILMALASKYQENTVYMSLAPDELAEFTELGTKDKWTELMKLQETQNFIKGQMAFLGQVDQRKTYFALVKLALEGNQQAAKQVQELSGIMNQQDSNRVIVLHRIPRPEKKEVTE